MNKMNKKVFENEQYQITEIPLNYRIDFKLEIDGVGRWEGKRVKALPYPFYSNQESGLSAAVDLAETAIEHYYEDNER